MVKPLLYIKSFILLAGMITCLLMSGQALAGNITVSVDRNPVPLDESFHITYSADSDVSNPDFSVLNQDFEILNSSQSTNMSFINGSWTMQKHWDLAVMSKKSGVITIPPVPFGKEMSPSLRLTVSKATTAPKKYGDPGAHVFIEVSTDVKQAWVQSEIIYTVRLFSNIPVSQPTLSNPKTSNPDTIISKLGGVKNYEAFRNGVQYSVSELKFAAFPQHSGDLTFEPLLFQGLITNNAPQSIFDAFMQQGTMKRLRSNAITVKVKPIPPGQDPNTWLPARHITLTDKWSDDISQLKTGVPVTRTITLSADGLTSEQLPSIKIPDVKGLQQYPDQPALKNDKEDTGVTGIRTMKTALIPNHSGDYTLPAVSVSWWNTRTGKPEVATMPAQVLHVSGAANTLANPPTTNSQPSTGITTAKSQPPTMPPVKLVSASGNAQLWRWISISLAIAWLLTTVLLVLWKRRPPAAGKGKTSSLTQLAREVEKHCETSQAAQTRQALLDWAKARWPSAHIANLAEVAQQCHPELGTAIRELNSALYGSSPGAWQGQRLAEAFNKYRDSAPGRQTRDSGDSLEPLYK